MADLNFSSGSHESSHARFHSLRVKKLLTGLVERDRYESICVPGAEQHYLVRTGIGPLGWLRDVSNYVELAAGLLKLCGNSSCAKVNLCYARWTMRSRSLTQRESFPSSPRVLRLVDRLLVKDKSDPFRTHMVGLPSSSEKHARFKLVKTRDFDDGLAEMVQVLIDAGMIITMVQERDSVP